MAAVALFGWMLQAAQVSRVATTSWQTLLLISLDWQQLEQLLQSTKKLSSEKAA
jgi:hypothetical protein